MFQIIIINCILQICVISLKRREALLRGTEAFYNANKDEADSYLTDFRRARDRNEQVLKVGIIVVLLLSCLAICKQF